MTTPNEKVFAKGFIAKRKDTAPDWVVCNLSLKVDEAQEFIQQHAKKGWVNLSVLIAKETKKPYVVLDTYEPKQEQEQRKVSPEVQDEMEKNLPEKNPFESSNSNSDELPF